MPWSGSMQNLLATLLSLGCTFERFVVAGQCPRTSHQTSAAYCVTWNSHDQKPQDMIRRTACRWQPHDELVAWKRVQGALAVDEMSKITSNTSGPLGFSLGPQDAYHLR